MLFSGPSGIGKRQIAWALAQTLLCAKPNSPCGECSCCRTVLAKQNESVLAITYQTLQIRLQDVKAIPPFLSLQSFSKAKVVLIDEAEKLNLQASNFLLKIIEEPPPKSFFILISASPSQLSLTIRSRVQNWRFKALPQDIIAELAPEGTADWVISGTRGRLDLLEELNNQSELRSLSFELWDTMIKSGFLGLSLDFSKKINNRKEALRLNRFWQEILRDALFLKMGHLKQLIHGDKIKELQRLSCLPKEILHLFGQKILKIEADLKANADYVLCFENFVISLNKELKNRPHFKSE